MTWLVALRGPWLAALLAIPACVCTQEGCESFESLSVKIPLSDSELEGAALQVCRNDECFTATLALANIDWSDASHPKHEIEVEPVEPPAEAGDVRALCYLSRDDAGFALVFEWYGGNEDRVERGDVLRVSVDPVEGGESFVRDAKVTAIDENYPNGEECDTTPCRSATLHG